MKFLEELEQKVLRIVSQNKELQTQVDVLESKNALLIEENCLLQRTLQENNTVSQSLTQERASMQATVDLLLMSIESLEKTL